MRMNDSSIRVRRFQREKLFSIEYMGYDRDHAMKDYENRVASQMTRGSLWILTTQLQRPRDRGD